MGTLEGYNHRITKEHVKWMNSPEVLKLVEDAYARISESRLKIEKKARLLGLTEEEVKIYSVWSGIRKFWKFEEDVLKIPEPYKLWDITDPVNSPNTIYKGPVIDGYFIGFIPPVYAIGNLLLAYSQSIRHGLKYVNALPSTLKSMNSAFGGAKNLISICDIPDSVESMFFTFNQCINLRTVGKLPKGIKKLQFTFYCCEMLAEVPDLPDSIEDLDSAFHGCIRLRRVNKLPKSLIKMGSTFYGCTELEYTCDLPDGVRMANHAFGFTGLKRPPKLPKSIQIANSICGDCDYLESPPALPIGCAAIKALIEDKTLSNNEGLLRGILDGTKYQRLNHVYVEHEDGTVRQYDFWELEHFNQQ